MLDILSFCVLFRITFLHCLFINILLIYKRMMYPKVYIIKIDCWQNFRPKSVFSKVEASNFLWPWTRSWNCRDIFSKQTTCLIFPEKDNSGPLRIACFTHVLPQIEPLWKWSHPLTAHTHTHTSSGLKYIFI